jgi:hypothetical protein
MSSVRDFGYWKVSATNSRQGTYSHQVYLLATFQERNLEEECSPSVHVLIFVAQKKIHVL